MNVELSKEQMNNWADFRIKDLESRGFEKAGLYDRPGVSGTRVMYILHRADKPHIYADLPANPQISASVDAWKEVNTFAGLPLTGGVAAVSGFLHYLVSGPNRVTGEDEDNAEKLVGGNGPEQSGEDTP
jgi:formate dehydrogenase iron-sulfur subunit